MHVYYLLDIISRNIFDLRIRVYLDIWRRRSRVIGLSYPRMAVPGFNICRVHKIFLANFTLLVICILPRKTAWYYYMYICFAHDVFRININNDVLVPRPRRVTE